MKGVDQIYRLSNTKQKQKYIINKLAPLSSNQELAENVDENKNLNMA